jgi:hypothetical protein
MIFAKTACPANLRVLRRISGREVWPPADSFHLRWGAGGNIVSTTIPAHIGGGPNRSLGGRSRTLGGGDPSSHGSWRVSRDGRIGSHSGGPLYRAGRRGGCSDGGGNRSRGRRGSQLRPPVCTGGRAGGGVWEAPPPEPGEGPSPPPLG